MNASTPRVSRQQQRGRATRPDGRLQPAQNLNRAAYATILKACDSGFESPEDVIRSRWKDDEVTPLVLRSATVPADSSTWAGAISQTVVADYIQSLQSYSAAAALIGLGTSYDLSGVYAATFPKRSGLPRGDLAWIAPGAPIPVDQRAFTSVTHGPLKKLAIISTITQEIAQSRLGLPAISQVLRDDLSATLDTSMFDSNAASSLRPAGILNGITPVTASTNADPTLAMLADLAALGAAVIAGGGEDAVFVMAPEQALTASLRLFTDTPPQILLTRALPAGTVVALDPDALIFSGSPIARFSSSTEAVLVMDDAAGPFSTAGSPATVSAPIANMLQRDLVALRLILEMTWSLTFPAVSYVSSVTW